MLYDRLYDFQKKAVESALVAKTYGIFAEQGTGKTWITAGIIEKLADDRFQCLLVVPLANIVTTWETMLRQVACGVYRDWETFKVAKGPRILLIHYEAMPKLDKKIISHKWTMVVFDESQRIKSRGSRQSRIAGRIKDAEYRIILSGTPFDDLMDDPQELWAQMRFMNPELFGRRWSDYEDEFLYRTGYMGYKRAFRKTRLPVVLKRVEPYILRLKKEDVLSLPPIYYYHTPVSLCGQQRRVYEEMEATSVSEIDGHVISAGLEITRLVKLQQICGGFVKTDEDDEIRLGFAKLEKVVEIVESEDKPLVIFAKYRFEVAQVARRLTRGKYNVSIIDGKSRKTRTQTIRDFQAGKIDILVAQVRTGGVGIDLFRSSTVIFYSTTFSFIDFEQAVARVHRQGQTRPVKIYLLYAKNTVDKLIYDTILSKRNVSEEILRHFHPKDRTRRPTMAKAEKTPKAETPAAEKAPKAPETKYGITDLCAALGVEPASARVKLRAAKIEKVGGRYGWNTKAEMNEVLDKIKAKSKAAKKKAEDAGADDGDDDDDDDE